MRTIDKTTKVSRRLFLRGSSYTALGTVALGGGATLLDPKGAWAMDLKSLKPKTMATLILLARDLYPHDRLTDATYAKAVSKYDGMAANDPSTKTMLEHGCGGLDEAAQKAWKVDYLQVGWEEQRVSLLMPIQDTVFFQTIRGSLITDLYNQENIWQKFGYEGASADKGGYLHRGFNDIDWLNTDAAKPAKEASL